MKYPLSIVVVMFVLWSLSVPVFVQAAEENPNTFCSVLGWLVQPIGFCEIEPLAVLDIPEPVTDTLEETYSYNFAPVAVETPLAMVSDYLNPSPVQPIEIKTVNEYITIQQNGVSEDYVNIRILALLSYIQSLPLSASVATAKSNYLSPVNSGDFVTKEYLLKSLDKVSNQIDNSVPEIIPQTAFTNPTVTGTVYLEPSTPTQTSNRLYNFGGDLYWNGIAVTSSTTGDWSVSGSDLFRLAGNVGIGTSSPYAKFSLVGDMALTGGLYDNSATRGTSGQVLKSTGTGVQWGALITTAVTEGSNLYWTPTRFDNRLAATTTLPSITTLLGLSSVGAITTGTWNATPINDSYINFGTGASQVSAADIPTTDPGSYFVGATQNVNSVLQHIGQEVAERWSSGVVSGGEITAATGNQVNIASGVGYINSNRITWGASTNVAMLNDGDNWISIDSTGSVRIDGTEPSIDNFIRLGYVFTTGGNTAIGLAASTPSYAGNYESRNNHFVSKGIGAVIETGNIVSETTPLAIIATSGTVNSNLKGFTMSDATTFTKWYQSADNGWVTDTANNLVNTTRYNIITNNQASALPTMTAGYWKKDLILRTLDGNLHYVYGQAEYATEQAAKDGALPTIPGAVSNGGSVYLATAVTQNGDTSLASRLYDIRPSLARVFGFGTSGTTGSVASHAALSGLTSDDHSQYILTNGGRLMTGNLQMNNNAITGVTNFTMGGLLTNTRTTEQLRLGYDVTNYTNFTVGATGALTIGTTGSGTTTITNGVNVGGGNGYYVNGALALSGSLGSNTTIGFGNTVNISGLAVGNGNTASAINSNAFGRSNIASSLAASAVGISNTASDIFSTAFGLSNKATSTDATAFGYQNNAGGLDSVAFGNNNKAYAAGSIAIGKSVTNTTANSLMIGPSNTSKLTILSSGNVGIGTTSPYAKLSVVGNVVASSFNATSSVGYQLGGTTILTAPAVGLNTLVGRLAGGAITSGVNNTFVGNNTGPVNTSGSNNSALGISALMFNTTGSDNMAFGVASLVFNSNGSKNTAVGNSSLFFSNSSANTALGYQSGYNNSLGASSTFIGYQAGYANTSGSFNTFLGHNAGNTDGTTATLNNLTNATAIGYNAQVTRSNSLILGGKDAYAVNVGIGTTSPYAKLSVVGNVVADSYDALSATATSTFKGSVVMGNNQDVAARLSVNKNGNGLATAYGVYSKLSGAPTMGIGLKSIASGVTAIGVSSELDNLGGVTTGYGFKTSSLFTGTGMTTAYGLHIDSFASTNSSNYGVYIDGQGNGTNRFALYAAGTTDKSYFGGNVGIGTTSPYAKLSVVGKTVSDSFDALSTTATSSFAAGVKVGVNTGYFVGTKKVLNLNANDGFAVGLSNVVTGGAFSGAAIGNTNTISNVISTAIGYGNISSGINATAIGNTNNASGTTANAFGFSNYATAVSATAMGYSNTAAGASSVAMGRGNNVSGNNTIAIGAGITNAIADSLQIGPSNTAKLTILSNGNFGIGTVSPSAKLSVASTLSTADQIGGVGVTLTGAGSLPGGSMYGNKTILSGNLGVVPPATKIYMDYISEASSCAGCGFSTFYGSYTDFTQSSSNGTKYGYYVNNSGSYTANHFYANLSTSDTAYTASSTLSFTGTFLKFTKGTNTTLIVKGDGKVGIGTSTPAKALQVIGDIRAGTSGTNGCIENFAGTALAGTCSSDEKLKRDVAPIGSVLSKLTQITPSTFYWNNLAANKLNNSTDTLNYGLIAQNVATVFPDMVSTTSNGYLGVNYSMLPILTLQGLLDLNFNLEGLSSSTAAVIDASGEKTFVGRFIDRMTSWFASATNGIDDFFANRVRTKTLCIGDSEEGETCITKAQLDSLLSGSAASVSTGVDTSNSMPVIITTVEAGSATTTEPTSNPETPDAGETINEVLDQAGNEGVQEEQTPEPEIVEVVEVVDVPVIEEVSDTVATPTI